MLFSLQGPDNFSKKFETNKDADECLFGHSEKLIPYTSDSLENDYAKSLLRYNLTFYLFFDKFPPGIFPYATDKWDSLLEIFNLRHHLPVGAHRVIILTNNRR